MIRFVVLKVEVVCRCGEGLGGVGGGFELGRRGGIFFFCNKFI